MDVIALVRAGFAHAVAPLGTALTEDQLALMWRVAPEPILAFDGDEAGLRAGTRAAHLALPHLKPGHSLRFAFLPAGEDPDTLIRGQGPGGMAALLEAAEPLARVLWRAETEAKDFSTPERRAGLERALADLVGRISDSDDRRLLSPGFQREGVRSLQAPQTGRRARAGRRRLRAQIAQRWPGCRPRPRAGGLWGRRDGVTGGPQQPAGPHGPRRGR